MEYPTDKARLVPWRAKRTYGDVRHRARAGPRGRALGAARRPRAAAGPQALHRPARGPAPRQPRRPRPAAARARAARASCAGASSPPPAGSRVYELTERGHELEPVVIALGRWGSVGAVPPGRGGHRRRRPRHRAEDALRPGGRRGHGAPRYELRLGEQRFRPDVADGGIEIAHGSAPSRPPRRRRDRARDPDQRPVARAQARRGPPRRRPLHRGRPHGGHAPARALPAPRLVNGAGRALRRRARRRGTRAGSRRARA